MRQFTPWPLAPGQPTRADKLSRLKNGLDQARSTFNGEHLNPGEITADRLSRIRRTATLGKLTRVESTFNLWLSYHSYEQQQLVMYPTDPGLSPDWQPIQFNGFTPELVFDDGASGGLHGELVVDLEMRDSIVVSAEMVDAEAWEQGATPWAEVGVFVGGLLIASTGRLYGGRESVSVPFLSPVHGGTARVKAYVRANIGNLERAPNTNIRPLIIHGFQLWGRRPRA